MAPSSKSKRGHRNSGKDCSKWPFIVAAIAILVSILWNDTRNNTDENDVNVDNDCGLVMANSAMTNAGWGIFMLKDVAKGDAVVHGDVVIQLTDVLVEYASDFQVMLSSYSWLGHNGGGSLEASSVSSIMPGVGALANGHSLPTLSNVAASLPQVSHGGVTRMKSPGAGASTHYNVQWLAKKSLRPGDELILSYGRGWKDKLPHGNPNIPTRTVKELSATGICMDNIRPGKSSILHAGRGAFATRPIPKGKVIAPAPLIVIPRREALRTHRIVVDPTTNKQEHVFQLHLLMNYCFGHSNSSLLFYPYSPITNLINHDSQQPNARLQWSQSRLFTNREWLEWPLAKIQSLQRTGLLMEIVATRDIEKDQEILLNYGPEWERAWSQHTANWKPDSDKNYQYPFEVKINESSINDSLADNIQTACFYEHRHDDETTASSGDKVVQWQRTRATMKQVQPCRLIRRDDSGSFTAKLLDSDIVVTNIPRDAIVLKDKPYASDQHLASAFRHEIGIPSDIFPKQWMDLAK